MILKLQLNRFWIILHLSILIIILSACSAPPPDSEKLQVVATTSILGDVVSQITGEDVDLTILMPPGIDPHSYQPTPQDLAALSKADIIFVNGFGLETGIETYIESAGGDGEVVVVSDGVEPLYLGGEPVGEDNVNEPDPHIWLDPNNVLIWVNNISKKLIENNPVNSERYLQRAQDYTDELAALNSWILEQAAQLPSEKKQLVSDHDSLGYFTRAYGFTTVGVLIPSFSTVAEPSALALAQLEDTINDLEITAVFVGVAGNNDLAERLAEDTGAKLIPLYIASLSSPQGPAATYLEMMRFNVRAIVTALK